MTLITYYLIWKRVFFQVLGEEDVLSEEELQLVFGRRETGGTPVVVRIFEGDAFGLLRAFSLFGGFLSLGSRFLDNVYIFLWI